MKIALTEEPTFTAQVGDLKIEGLRVISEWNGMKELKNAKGQTIIVGCDRQDSASSGFGEVFDGIFGLPRKLRVIEGTLVRGSPDIVAALQAAEKPVDAPSA